MSILERINRKINNNIQNYLPRPHILIVGKEEYYELITNNNLTIPFSNPTCKSGAEYCGMKITLSKKLRYLAVISKKPRKYKYTNPFTGETITY